MPQEAHHDGRLVVGNIALSLDGRVAGSAGEHDMGWIVPHAISDVARDHLDLLTRTATTALLGRKNYQGFGGYWPAVAKDETAEPRDRAFGQWLDAVEKVVFSTTLTRADWDNARIVNEPPAQVVRELRRTDGGDIVVLGSSSVIKNLLAADELDRLSITLCPELVGGGPRLLQDKLPRSSWQLVQSTAGEAGTLCLFYDRIRENG